MPLPSTLDPESTLLFLGSGFSSTATNIAGSHPPVGSELAQEFERQLGIERGELNLKVLADEMHYRGAPNLYQTLYNLFTIARLSDEQSEILSRKWLRIFTTNYDDAIEFAYQQNRIRCQNFSWDDPIPRRIPTGSIVHIHGAISRATEDNILDQLVLNENSYIRQHFERSPWYEELDRAIDHCSACFFVGYSLSDYHIAALLMQKPNRKDKIFFIMRDMPAEIPRRQLEQFGEIHAIGTRGFAELCRTLPAPPPITDLHALRGVRYIDPFRDRKAVVRPTSREIFGLVTYGHFNFQRCLTNLPEANYVVPREELALSALSELRQAKTLILHSYLGNGKTIFVAILAYHLSTRGYKSFLCKSAGPETTREIRALQGQENIVILFDSYDLAYSTIPIFEEVLVNAKYVVTVRTGVQEVRFHEIVEKFPEPVRRLSLNGIRRAEREIFARLLDEAGVLGARVVADIDACADYREIVTSLYNHEGIRAQIAAEIAPLMSDRRTMPVLITCLLLSWIGLKVSPALLRAVTGLDPYVELKHYEEAASEIFNLDDDELEVRSPIFAEYILKTHTPSDHLLQIIERLLVTAVQRKRERGFQAILSRLMRVAALKIILSGSARLQLIENLFQRLQRDVDINAEPLFWLQYAILANEMDELSQAEGFLETAYKRASAAHNFETFQIDTYALRLLLRMEERSSASDVRRFDDILQKSELVLSMLNDANRRWHAIQVLDGFEPFVRARVGIMSTPERNALVLQLNRLVTALSGLPIETRAETGSDIIKRSLEAAIAHIVNSKSA
jgi:SIR2-like protein